MPGWHFPVLPSRQAAQMGDVDDNPVHMCAEEEFWTVAKVAFLWGRSNGTSGEHPKGLALDFSVLEYGGGVSNPGPARAWMGNKVANWLWANRARLGVWYVIWNRRIISSNRSSYAYNRWVTYRGANPHTDHVHTSYYSADIYQPPVITKPVEPEDELTPEDRKWIADRIDEAVNDAVNQALGKAVAAVQASEQRIRQYTARRTTARINQETSDAYGYGGKLEYQAGALAADASWRIRRLEQEMAKQFGQSDRLQHALHPPEEVPDAEPPAEPTEVAASDEA